jgi:signal peptidase II
MNSLILFLLILIVAMFDQLTKLMVIRNIPFQDSIIVVPGFFSVTHVYNTGAAFGMMHDSNLFFIILSVTVFVVLIVMRHHFTGYLMTAGWALLISGILGNVTDRLRLGHVVDFLDFQCDTYHWPSFNVADSCICIAAGLFLLSSFQSPTKPKES